MSFYCFWTTPLTHLLHGFRIQYNKILKSRLLTVACKVSCLSFQLPLILAPLLTGSYLVNYSVLPHAQTCHQLCSVYCVQKSSQQKSLLDSLIPSISSSSSPSLSTPTSCLLMYVRHSSYYLKLLDLLNFFPFPTHSNRL